MREKLQPCNSIVATAIRTPGKDSRRIVTDAPALALEVGQNSSSLPLLDGLDLNLGQLLPPQGANAARCGKIARAFGLEREEFITLDS